MVHFSFTLARRSASAQPGNRRGCGHPSPAFEKTANKQLTNTNTPNKPNQTRTKNNKYKQITNEIQKDFFTKDRFKVVGAIH